MKDLLTGIYTEFTSAPASSFYTKIGGKLYLNEAPSTAVMPYAVYDIVANVADENWHTKYEETTVDFTLYSDSAAGALEISQMYEGLTEQFDNVGLTVANYNHIHMQRTNSWLDKIPADVPNKSIWQYVVEYNILTRKTT